MMSCNFDVKCSNEVSTATYVKIGKVFCSCGARMAISKIDIRKIKNQLGYNSREARQFANSVVYTQEYPGKFGKIGVFEIEPKKGFTFITTTALVNGPMIVQIRQ